MKTTKFLTLLILFSVVAFGGLRNVAKASTNANAGSEKQSSQDSGILAFFQNLYNSATQALSLTQDSSDQITAEIVNENGPNQLMIHGKIVSSENTVLPGLFQISLNVNPVNQTIIGGHWLRIVQTGDGAEVGTLRGEITGGSITLGDNGRATAVKDIQLSVTGGTGSYANVNSGSGAFEGSIRTGNGQNQAQPPLPPTGQPNTNAAPNQQGPQPAFSGSMSLSF